MRRRIEVRGIVQGVGFRPWVHQLAKARGLHGFVRNSPSGVTIEIEGPLSSQESFLEALRSGQPAIADIDEILDSAIASTGETGFWIQDSEDGSSGFALVPPDIATCPDCLAEFREPSNRRYGYPFTNCTHCGPRYTIILDIPYDRRFTTMAASPCARTARPSITTLATAVFMRNPTPAPCAALG